MQRVLILGATSAVGRALATEMARGGARLLLSSRSPEELDRLASDLRIRTRAQVDTHHLDVLDFAAHERFIEASVSQLGGLDGVVWLIGELGDQPGASRRPDSARRLIQVNLTAAASLLAGFADLLENQGRGFILGFSSVAGDRGRQSNYAYGAAKGGLSLYLQGLRNRLDRAGVMVYTVKPGFIDTAMTYGLPGLFLVASPERVARSACRLLRRSSGDYYIPWFWRWIMLVVRCIPETVFKRLKL